MFNNLCWFDMKEEIHIGQMIRTKLKEKDCSVIWLAEEIHCSPANIYKIMRNPTINVEHLLHISKALNYNFFCYYCDMVAKFQNESTVCELYNRNR